MKLDAADLDKSPDRRIVALGLLRKISIHNCKSGERRNRRCNACCYRTSPDGCGSTSIQSEQGHSFLFRVTRTFTDDREMLHILNGWIGALFQPRPDSSHA